MSNFNYDEYDNLINSRDYLGAANYMSKFRASTPEDQIKANNLIRQLKREGEIRAARLSKMTDEQRQAYDFFSAMEGKGTIPHTIYDEKTGQPKMVLVICMVTNILLILIILKHLMVKI